MNVGDRYEESIELSSELVAGFARLTGDANAVHFDFKAAQQAGFARTVVHGMLAASFFSYVPGTKFPGSGTIYLGQTIKFLAPIFVDERVTYRFEVKSEKPNHRIFVVATDIIGEDGIPRVTGEAVIKAGA